LRRIVNLKAITLKVSEEVSGTYSVGAMLIVVASLLRGGRCRRCLLPGVVINLSGVERLLTWLLAYTWGSSHKLLLSSNSSGSVGVLTLLVLLICLSILRWYICRDDQDLAI
jgi:hypothetical protein